ncbi:MAG TPA: carboxypeptidase-like regulatory domain-containing protein [Gemmatimonadaceae bacterium]
MRRLLASCAVLAAVPVLALAQSEPPSVRGMVVDSVHARPLVGATVIATPATGFTDTVFHSALSDARGRFVLSGLRQGRYVVSVEHPWIDSTGIGAPSREVEVRGETSVVLAIPSAATLRRVFCPVAVRDTSLGVVVGTIRRAGTTVPGASVVFTWSDFDLDRTTLAVHPRQVTASVTADSSGVYRACGLPLARSILLQAQSATPEQSGVIEEQIGEAGLLVRDITLDAREVAASAAAASTDTTVALGRYVLTGRVQSTAGLSVEAAQIHLLGTSHRAVSGQDGAFRFAGLPGGTQGFEILALGYYPRRLRVEIGNQTVPITVKLERAAVVLDSLRVIAKRVHNPNAARGSREFDERSRSGMGRYFTEEEIERRRPFETADLFRFALGVKVAGLGADALLVSTRSLSSQSLRSNPTSCAVDVFIDGFMVQPSDVNRLPPEALHGAELYSAGTVPAKYRAGPCGALFLWTK